MSAVSVVVFVELNWVAKAIASMSTGIMKKKTPIEMNMHKLRHLFAKHLQ